MTFTVNQQTDVNAAAGEYLINYLAYLDLYPASAQLEDPFRVNIVADTEELD